MREGIEHMVPLLQELGLDVRCEFVEANEAFLQLGLKLQAALQGGAEFTGQDMALLLEMTQDLALRLEISADVIMVHEPRLLPLAGQKTVQGKKWIWGCCLDLSQASPEAWQQLAPFIEQYDAVTFLAPSFARALSRRSFLIPPAIDPLSERNRGLAQPAIDAVLAKYNIPRDKPILLQVSRFDQLKGPAALLQAFEVVRKGSECRLVMAGTATSKASVEPVIAALRERASSNPDVHILLVPAGRDHEINALQRASAVIVQEALSEGFGLVASEALWKARPVVAVATRGLPLQIKNKFTGLLTHDTEETASALKQLLTNPEYARRLAENGREHVRHNFLIVRQLRDYILLLVALEHQGDIIQLE
ncbi:MAG: glycosyltransferase [Chloroflexi bacterium]|nr:glycosyltransferase [Chloroflexota bacterium]